MSAETATDRRELHRLAKGAEGLVGQSSLERATPKRASSRREIAVFGEAIWDLFPARAGEPIGTRRTDVRHGGGAPANVARTLARLGLDVALVTAVGDDALGQGMLAELADAGVSTAYVQRLAARTAVTFVDVDRDGGRSFLFYRHPSADMTLAPSMLDRRAFAARWLHVGSSTLARSPARETTLRALALARAHGARLSVDLNARPHLWPSRRALVRETAALVERADLLKVSEEDLAALGLAPTVEGARRLHRRRGVAVTLFTLGARGAVGLWGDLVIEVPAPKVRAVDVTGAGDAFTAGALATFARGDRRDLDDAGRRALLGRTLTLGCALGARAVTRLGATDALRKLDRFARRLDPALAPRARRTHR